MNRINLIENGYFAKEMPPCFTTKKLASNFDVIMQDIETKRPGHLNNLLSAVTTRTDLSDIQKQEEKNRIKEDFKNKLAHSSCVLFSIPKAGLSRKEIKMPKSTSSWEACFFY